MGGSHDYCCTRLDVPRVVLGGRQEKYLLFDNLVSSSFSNLTGEKKHTLKWDSFLFFFGGPERKFSDTHTSIRPLAFPLPPEGPCTSQPLAPSTALNFKPSRENSDKSESFSYHCRKWQKGFADESLKLLLLKCLMHIHVCFPNCHPKKKFREHPRVMSLKFNLASLKNKNK